MGHMAEDNMHQIMRVAPLPLTVFEEVIASYLKVFENISQELLFLHEILEQDCCNSSSQSKDICTFLLEVEEPTHELCTLLGNTAKLPEEVIAKRYLLLMHLQNTEEQIKKLLSLVTFLLDTRTLSSKKRQKQQQEVKKLFETFKRTYADMQFHACALLDQVHLQTEQHNQLSQSHKHSLLLQNAMSYEQMGREASEQGQKRYALECFERALALIEKVNDPQRKADILNDLGRTYSALGKKEEARHYLEDALHLTEDGEDNPRRISILNNLGLVYTDLGFYEEAIKHLKQALTLCKETPDSSEAQARVNNTLGISYNHLGKRELALYHYKQALDIRLETGDIKGQAITLTNIGWICDDVGQKEQARRHYEHALSISREIGDLWSEAKTLGNLGQTLADVGACEEALIYCKQALSVLKEVGDHWEENKILNNLVRIYSMLGQKDLTREYYHLALQNS